MVAFIVMCLILTVLAAAIIQVSVEAAGFYGALAAATVFAALLAVVAEH